MKLLILVLEPDNNYNRGTDCLNNTAGNMQHYNSQMLESEWMVEAGRGFEYHHHMISMRWEQVRRRETREVGNLAEQVRRPSKFVHVQFGERAPGQIGLQAITPQSQRG